FLDISSCTLSVLDILRLLSFPLLVILVSQLACIDRLLSTSQSHLLPLSRSRYRFLLASVSRFSLCLVYYQCAWFQLFALRSRTAHSPALAYLFDLSVFLYGRPNL